MDKLETFRANQTYMCLDPHQNQGCGWYCESSLSLPVIFLLIVPYTFLWIIFFILCLSLPHCLVCVMQPCGHLLGRAGFLALLYVTFYCIFVTFPYGDLGQVWY